MGFLRFLIIFGILAIVGMAGYTLWELPRLATPSLMRLVEKDNIAFAENYTGMIWEKYRGVIMPLAASDPSQLKNRPEVLQFARETARYFKALPIVRANIYTANGVLLLTVDGGADGNLSPAAASPGPAFLSAHLRSTAAEGTLLPDANVRNGRAALVQTVAPILLPGDVAPEGTVEIIGTLPDLPQEILHEQRYAIDFITIDSITVLVLVLIGMLVVIRKSEAIITQQYEANAELMEAVAAAQAASRDKSQFLANVSHELRTPLNAIIGFSEILKNEVMAQLNDKKYMNYISDINMSGIHLLSLINDILDYSKAEAGKLELEVSEVNATKLVQNSIRLVSPRAEAGSVTLAETLPREQFTMTTDSKKFKQVLLNLLSNAVKFTPAGGTVSVNAWHNVADDTITFEVRDTGIGIAPKDISRAMAPFGQVDNTLKRKYEGTGLGLPLTKRFVELMGGKFTIESEINKGTKITFTLPRVVTVREGVVVKQVA